MLPFYLLLMSLYTNKVCQVASSRPFRRNRATVMDFYADGTKQICDPRYSDANPSSTGEKFQV